MKKVLISFDELENMRSNRFGQKYIRSNYEEKSLAEWFTAQPEAPQWVSIEDDLPAHGQRVFIRNGDIILALVFNKKLNVFMSRASSALHHHIKDVTHWMPIPRLPEKENKEEWVCGGGPITQGLEVDEYYRKHKKVKDGA